MSTKRRIVVYQFRNSEYSRMLEQDSCIRSMGLQADDFHFIDALQQAPCWMDMRDARGIILGGSPLYVKQVPYRAEFKKLLTIARFLNQAVLGICFGAQLIADLCGGSVRHDPESKEFGTFEIALTTFGMSNALFTNIPRTFDAQCAHHDRIIAIPLGAEVLASSARCYIQAFGFPGKNIYGVQFHPERSKKEQEERFVQSCEITYSYMHDATSARPRLRESPFAEQVMRNFVQLVM